MAYFDCFIGDTGGGVALVITCASQFAGANITITDGVTTYVEQCPSTSPYEITIPGITPGTWTISGTYSGTTFTTTKTILDFEAELLTIPDGSTVTPTDDIQTWLNCANIWDKAYTTIGEVLTDTTVLLALINDSNAVDYMVRSTTWVSNICADQTAMTYIGSDVHCTNTLLDDSTWFSAITSSTYFENVLNIKIPRQTGSSQSVIGNGSGAYASWCAFASAGNSVYAWNNDTTSNGLYVLFDFEQDVRCNRLNLRTWHYANNNYKVIASDDASTLIEIADIRQLIPNLANNTDGTAAFENSAAHRYWGFKVTRGDNYLYPGCNLWGVLPE